MDATLARGLTREAFGRYSRNYAPMTAAIRDWLRSHRDIYMSRRASNEEVKSFLTSFERVVLAQCQTPVTYRKMTTSMAGGKAAPRAEVRATVLFASAAETRWTLTSRDIELGQEKIFFLHGVTFNAMRNRFYAFDTQLPFCVTFHALHRFLTRHTDAGIDNFFNERLLRALTLFIPLGIAVLRTEGSANTFVMPYGDSLLLGTPRLIDNRRDGVSDGWRTIYDRRGYRRSGVQFLNHFKAHIHTIIDRGQMSDDQETLYARLDKYHDAHAADLWELFYLSICSGAEDVVSQGRVRRLQDSLIAAIMPIVTDPVWLRSVREPRLNWLDDRRRTLTIA